MARVPTTGFDWYLFVLLDDYEDDLAVELKRNLDAIGKAVGPDTLVVHGYDNDTFLSEVTWAMRAHMPDTLVPPALVLSSQVPKASPSHPDAVPPPALPDQRPAGSDPTAPAQVLVVPLAAEYAQQGTLRPLLNSLIQAIHDPAAFAALTNEHEDPSALCRHWGWTNKYLSIKPSWFGFSIDVDRILTDLVC